MFVPFKNLSSLESEILESKYGGEWNYGTNSISTQVNEDCIIFANISVYANTSGSTLTTNITPDTIKKTNTIGYTKGSIVSSNYIGYAKAGTTVTLSFSVNHAYAYAASISAVK